MSEEGFETEIDLTNVVPGKEVAKTPVGPTELETQAMPDKLTLAWIDAQAPRKAWKTAGALTPTMVLNMSKLVRKGLSQSAVVARSGLSKNMWYLWRNRAVQGEEPYATWYRCMMHASSDLEAELITNVRNAALDDWKAATWLLGKINREDYGDKSNAAVNINVEGDAVGKKETINTLTDENAAKIATLMGKIGALPSSDVIEGEIVEGD